MKIEIKGGAALLAAIKSLVLVCCGLALELTGFHRASDRVRQKVVRADKVTDFLLDTDKPLRDTPGPKTR